MRSAAVCVAVLNILFASGLAQAQDDSPSTHKHLRGMKWIIGDWVATFNMPPGHPLVGLEGTKVVSNVSWRWMLKRDFMVINFKRQVGEETHLGKEIIGWDATSEKLVHWLFWNGGSHGSGEWTCNGDTWLLKWEIIGPDKKVHRGTSRIVKKDNDTFTWQATDTSTDGQPKPDWPLITYKRKKD
jgi:hypothetical protein